MNARPGRKLAAEKNRVAAMTLYEFYRSDGFDNLPSPVRVAIIQLCRHRWMKVHGVAGLRKGKEDHGDNA